MSSRPTAPPPDSMADLFRQVAFLTTQIEDMRFQLDNPASSHSSRSTAAPHNRLHLKLDAPRFEGTDTHGWIFKISQFFTYHQTPEEDRITTASSYLDGAALAWYQWMYRNGQISSWAQFLEKLAIRFPPSTFVDCASPPPPPWEQPPPLPPPLPLPWNPPSLPPESTFRKTEGQRSLSNSHKENEEIEANTLENNDEPDLFMKRKCDIEYGISPADPSNSNGKLVPAAHAESDGAWKTHGFCVSPEATRFPSAAGLILGSGEQLARSVGFACLMEGTSGRLARGSVPCASYGPGASPFSTTSEDQPSTKVLESHEDQNSSGTREFGPSQNAMTLLPSSKLLTLPAFLLPHDTTSIPPSILPTAWPCANIITTLADEFGLHTTDLMHVPCHLFWDDYSPLPSHLVNRLISLCLHQFLELEKVLGNVHKETVISKLSDDYLKCPEVAVKKFLYQDFSGDALAQFKSEIVSFQSKQWDPGKITHRENFYNLEDKVDCEGVGNDMIMELMK